MFGNMIKGYMNSKRMAINGMVERLCKEDDVGYMDMWDSFVRKEELYLCRDPNFLYPLCMHSIIACVLISRPFDCCLPVGAQMYK